MLTLLHISDLHFGPHFLPQVAEAVLDCARQLAPDVIVASGDFTQRAKRTQFAAAREFLDRLPPAPLVVVPGNHDIPLFRVFERLLTPYALYRQYIADEWDSVLKRAGAVIAAINTTDPLLAITDGRISRSQLDFCSEAFRDAPPGAARIVVAHHHFAPAPDYADHGDVMWRAKEALDRFAELQVDLILGGHLHRSYIGNSLDVYPSKDRASGIIIVQSGTTTSGRGRGRERKKNSFNLIEIGDDVIRVTQYMYFSDLGTFAPIGRHTYPRRARRFLPDISQLLDAGKSAK